MKNAAAVRVAHSAASPVSALFEGWGTVAYSSPRAVVAAADEDPLLCAVSGTNSETGAEVIALLDEAPPPEGTVVSVRESLTFDKVRSFSTARTPGSRLPVRCSQLTRRCLARSHARCRIAPRRSCRSSR